MSEERHGNALRLSPFSSAEVIILWPKKKNLYRLLRQAFCFGETHPQPGNPLLGMRLARR